MKLKSSGHNENATVAARTGRGDVYLHITTEDIEETEEAFGGKAVEPTVLQG